ncbi:MAG: HD domain-containing protein [Synergistetes bacterium]|nr:HD domain-containing protein [Synergistota bacterium]
MSFRPVPVELLKPGMELARTVYTPDGRVLLKEGAKLSERHIEALRKSKAGVLYIYDDRMSDISIIEPLSRERREEFKNSLKELCLEVIELERRESDRRYLRKKDPFAWSKVGEKIKEKGEELIEILKGYDKPYLNLLVDESEEKEDYLFHHMLMVAIIAAFLSRKVSFFHNRALDLVCGSLVYDIGLLKVPQEILDKAGHLSEEEFEEIKKHPRYGYLLMKRMGEALRLRVAHIAYQHHERWNGSGYPRGLKGERIFDMARLVAIIDFYDAVTHTRSYRSRILPHQALAFLKMNRGILFDPFYVDVFLRFIPPYPLGVMVKLSSGESGVVVGLVDGMLSRPRVRIFYDNSGREIKPFDVNLVEHPDIGIVGVFP